jgi:hypothetical protein
MVNPLGILRTLGVMWMFSALCNIGVDAQRIKVSQTCTTPSDCPLTLSEGFKTDLQFSLSQPIVCDASTSRECAVVVLLTNQDPKIVSVSPCLVKWTTTDWFQTRTVRLQAVETYKNDPTPRSVTIRTEPAISPSIYYEGFKANDILAKTQNRASAQCRATGDPHYTTFDGAYWHFYDGNTRPRTLVHLVRSTNQNRPFGELQVQTQMRGYPAVNCAIAGREGNNLFIVDACSGKLVITSKFGSELSQQPKVEVTGSTYTVYFKSGFWMRGVVSGTYVDLYVQTPGIDFNSVCGICGNFDGNPNNDYTVYMSTQYSQLMPCQQVLPSEDLWNWVPSSIAPPPVIPVGSEKCNYTETTYIKPILNNAPGEDITDELREAYSDSLENRTQFVFEDPTPVVVPYAGVTTELAMAACQRDITNSEAIQTCMTVFGPNFYNIPTRVKECAEDVVELQSYEATSGSIVGMTVECADYAVEKDMDDDTRLLNVLCMNACNGNGKCFNAKCTCDAGFSNPDCSYIDGKPPRITALYDTVCEVSGAGSCPRELAVTGRNFYKSSKLRCRYGDTIVNAVWLGGDSVLCAVPMEVYMKAEYETVNLQVTNDFENPNEWSNIVPFIFYNGACWSCNATTRICGPNPDSCRINDVCYHKGHVNAPDNVCQICDPLKSASEWTYSYTNTHLCSPVFDKQTYDHTIYCEAAKDTPLVTVRALNPEAAKDPNYRITYSIKHNVDHKEVEEFYKIDNITGVISALVTINHAQLSGGMDYNIGNPLTYNGFFMVRAVDNANNFAEANVVIELRGTSVDGTCNAPKLPTFNATIAENATIGTPLTRVVENAYMTAKTFSWWNEDGANGKFGINQTTGDVWVAKPLDYEEQKVYKMQVRITDSEGLWYLIDYTVFILDVNEPPMMLTLSGSSVVEDKIGAVVGTLSAIDPEGSLVTFTISQGGDSFTINGTKLVTRVALKADGMTGASVVNVTINAMDPMGLTFTKTFTITVINVNDPPDNIRLIQVGEENEIVTSFPENLLVGENIAQVVATDPEGDPYQCGVVSGTAFDIFYDGQTNYLRLIKAVDYETQKTVTVGIRCADIPKDGSNSLASPTRQIMLNVIDVNEGPQELNLTVTRTPVENVKPVTPLSVGTLLSKDYDANSNVSLKFTIISPKELFEIGSMITCTPITVSPSPSPSGQSCSVTLLQKEALDYESVDGKQPVVIRVEDGFGAWNEFTVIVPVIDVNEAPVDVIFSPSPQPFVMEGAPINTVITTITANDPDIGDSHTFTLINDGDGALKLGTILTGRRRDTSVSLLVANPAKFDFETNPTITFVLKVTDSGNQSLIVTKTIEVRDRPMEITSSTTLVSEATLVLTQKVATLILQNYDTAESLSWFLAAASMDNMNNNNDLFTIKGVSGSIPPQAELFLAKKLDYDASLRTLVVSVGVSFVGGRMPINKRITFDVTDVNEAPVFAAASFAPVEIAPNTPAGTVILSAPATDPEGTPITYSLSKQLSYIEVSDDGNLVLSAPAPLTYGSVTQLTLTATDATGLSKSVMVLITLADACELGPCNNKGVCNLCKLNGPGLIASGPTKPCDNLPLNRAKGYMCMCAAGFSGMNCDFSQESYTITVVIVPRQPIPSVATLTPNQVAAIKDKYIQITDLQGKVSRDDLSVTLGPNKDNIVVLTITRQSTSPATDKELNIGEFIFEYTIPDPSNPSKKITVIAEGSANPAVVQVNAVSTASSTEDNGNSASGVSSGVVAGVAVGIVLLLILVILVLVLIRKNNSRISFDKDNDAIIYSSHAINPTFKAPVNDAYIDIPKNDSGISNPMYTWYQPSMTRKDCTQYLMMQGEGAFIIRDSSATPGWHMLGVKTANEVIHEKIRYTEDGMYEMLSSKSQATQPKFESLYKLVEFYLEPREDMPYSLAVSNPIYDNHMLQNTTTNTITLSSDPMAPSLPLKDKEMDNVTALVRQSSVMHSNNGDDIYTNMKEAKQALKQFSDYHLAIPNNGLDNPMYLLTGVDCDEKTPKDTYFTAAE